jgi:hypothetical protein
MNSHGRFALYATFAAVCMFALGGCKSKSNVQQANPQQQDSTQPQAGVQPQGGSQAPAAQSASGAPASASRPAASSVPARPAAPPQPTAFDLPAGTRLSVRLDQDLGSKISQPGDAFTATVANDVVVNGQTVIARGARADGTVIDAKALGKFKGGAILAIKLERVQTRWGGYSVETGSIEHVEQGKGKRTAEFAGGGAGLGALVGALAGGGKGTAGGALTGNKQIVLPAETMVTFKLEQPLHVVEK